MNKDEGLIRAVGVRGLTAGMINYMIGAGIFVLPAVVAARVGGAAPVVYVICAVAMALIVLCFADAGSRVSLSGGTYEYAQVAFGPYIGFVVATSLWLGSAVLASAAVASVFVDTLGQVSPRLGEPVVRSVILILMYVGLAAVNIRGVRIGSGIVQTVTAAKLTPLLILVGVGLFAINAGNLAWPGMPPVNEIARTSVILIFAFLGIESALTPSGEVRNPADRKSTRLNSSHGYISYAVFCLKKKNNSHRAARSPPVHAPHCSAACCSLCPSSDALPSALTPPSHLVCRLLLDTTTVIPDTYWD